MKIEDEVRDALRARADAVSSSVDGAWDRLSTPVPPRPRARLGAVAVALGIAVLLVWGLVWVRGGRTGSQVAASPTAVGPTVLEAKPMEPCPKPVYSPGPPGTVLPETTIGRTAAATEQIVFGLADRHALHGFVFPAISNDGGKTWHLDGPCFYYAAAQGPSATSRIGATAPDWAYAWGRGGNSVKVTHDGGLHWYATGFPAAVRGVTASGHTLRAWLLGTRSTYVSRDYGLTWHLVDAASAPPEGLFLPRLTGAPPHYPAALIEGTLVEDHGCLELTRLNTSAEFTASPGEVVLPLWPVGTTATRTNDGGLRVDAPGLPSALAGQRMSVGGMFTPSLQDAEQKIGQPIPTECRVGAYWVATPVHS
jgi:hypothetical protein